MRCLLSYNGTYFEASPLGRVKGNHRSFSEKKARGMMLAAKVNSRESSLLDAIRHSSKKKVASYAGGHLA